jgi:DNA-binding transcriptional regulator YdaS (Cro superfamily)
MMEPKRGIDDAVEVAGSQEKLAQALGVTQQSVAKWVKRGYAPLARAREVEAMYGVPRKSLVDPRVVELLSDWEAAL